MDAITYSLLKKQTANIDNKIEKISSRVENVENEQEESNRNSPYKLSIGAEIIHTNGTKLYYDSIVSGGYNAKNNTRIFCPLDMFNRRKDYLEANNFSNEPAETVIKLYDNSGKLLDSKRVTVKKVKPKIIQGDNRNITLGYLGGDLSSTGDFSQTIEESLKGLYNNKVVVKHLGQQESSNGLPNDILLGGSISFFDFDKKDYSGYYPYSTFYLKANSASFSFINDDLYTTWEDNLGYHWFLSRLNPHLNSGAAFFPIPGHRNEDMETPESLKKVGTETTIEVSPDLEVNSDGGYFYDPYSEEFNVESYVRFLTRDNTLLDYFVIQLNTSMGVTDGSIIDSSILEGAATGVFNLAENILKYSPNTHIIITNGSIPSILKHEDFGKNDNFIIKLEMLEYGRHMSNIVQKNKNTHIHYVDTFGQSEEVENESEYVKIATKPIVAKLVDLINESL